MRLFDVIYYPSKSPSPFLPCLGVRLASEYQADYYLSMPTERRLLGRLFGRYAKLFVYMTGSVSIELTICNILLKLGVLVPAIQWSRGDSIKNMYII